MFALGKETGPHFSLAIISGEATAETHLGVYLSFAPEYTRISIVSASS
jgi:hypothetical protein